MNFYMNSGSTMELKETEQEIMDYIYKSMTMYLLVYSLYLTLIVGLLLGFLCYFYLRLKATAWKGNMMIKLIPLQNMPQ